MPLAEIDGNKIKQARQAVRPRLRQKALAARVGLNVSSLSSIETGYRPCSLATAGKIAEALSSLSDKPITVDAFLKTASANDDGQSEVIRQVVAVVQQLPQHDQDLVRVFALGLLTGRK